MDLDRYVLKMRLNKMQKCGISGPLIWSEVNRNLTAVQGYLVTQGTACWHVWCQDPEGEIQDIGFELAKREDAAFANIEKEYVMLPPEGMQVDKDLEVEARWEKYQEDPKGYWKSEPMSNQNFRAKIMRETKQRA